MNGILDNPEGNVIGYLEETFQNDAKLQAILQKKKEYFADPKITQIILSDEVEKIRDLDTQEHSRSIELAYRKGVFDAVRLILEALMAS